MTVRQDILPRTFPDPALAAFKAAYPDRHARLAHNLAGHPLFSRDAIAALAERLPPGRVEYNRGNLPLGVRPEDVPANGLSIADTIRGIDSNGSWMVLKNVERDRIYGPLLESALGELMPMVEAATGPMVHMEAFLFLSSPGSITPFHMDPEHNILLQIEGEKTMTVFPAGDGQLVPVRQSEGFHLGGHRNLAWDDSFIAKGEAIRLLPGDAISVPVKAPHFVQNGPRVSVSFSITWRSCRSIAEGDLHSLNARLRKLSLPVLKVGKRPERQILARFIAGITRRLGV